MARISLEMPEKMPFETEIPVRITEINYGGHLGNDAILSMMHEARMRFFNSLGCNELDVFGVATIMADVGITYKAEAHHGDKLKFQLGVSDITSRSFDLYYRIVKSSDNRVVAEAKTGILGFDYDKGKVTSWPKEFLSKLEEVFA